eukprot:TRINITY_DN3294_c0_g2_i1.p1 TRINITY_DN3294_c0_g2~~TRINITY_DN3294_c0_g2_i1.p1  ORF type:complete len:541 (-),score=248.91 TRINITY_DN3294_c0_g2_i1:1364-2986(-)
MFGHRRKTSSVQSSLDPIGNEKKEHVPVHKWWKMKRGFDRNHNEIPPIVEKTVCWIEKNALKTEGIFRVSGNVNQIQKLKKRFDKGKEVNLPQDLDPHTVAGVLKQFFIEPPESILTDELYEAFLHLMTINDEGLRVSCLCEVVQKLPIGNKIILKRLLKLLYTVSTFSEINKMTTSNLSICFSPTLLRKRNMEILAILSNSEGTKQLVDFFISHYQHVFEPETLPKSPSKKKEVSAEKEAVKKFQKTLRLGTIRLAKNKLKELSQMEDLEHISEQDKSLDMDQMTTKELEKVIVKREEIAPGASKVWEDFFKPPSGFKAANPSVSESPPKGYRQKNSTFSDRKSARADIGAAFTRSKVNNSLTAEEPVRERRASTSNATSAKQDDEEEESVESDASLEEEGELHEDLQFETEALPPVPPPKSYPLRATMRQESFSNLENAIEEFQKRNRSDSIDRNIETAEGELVKELMENLEIEEEEGEEVGEVPDYVEAVDKYVEKIRSGTSRRLSRAGSFYHAFNLMDSMEKVAIDSNAGRIGSPK